MLQPHESRLQPYVSTCGGGHCFPWACRARQAARRSSQSPPRPRPPPRLVRLLRPAPLHPARSRRPAVLERPERAPEGRRNRTPGTRRGSGGAWCCMVHGARCTVHGVTRRARMAYCVAPSMVPHTAHPLVRALTHSHNTVHCIAHPIVHPIVYCMARLAGAVAAVRGRRLCGTPGHIGEHGYVR